MRKYLKVKCWLCKKSILKTPWAIRQYKKRVFCSSKCQYESRKKGKFFDCFVCKKPVYKSPGTLHTELKKIKLGVRKTTKTFCSHSCANVENNKIYKTGVHHPNWTNGKGSYRARALKFLELRCTRGATCPLGEKELPRFMYEIDHKDGDRTNNEVSNLQVLCVWCHRQKHVKKEIQVVA